MTKPQFLNALDRDVINGLTVFAIIAFVILSFISGIFFLSAYVHGPYHPKTGPQKVCISGHDAAHYDDGWRKTEVCDDYGTVYPGYQPSPNPTETAVVKQ